MGDTFGKLSARPAESNRTEIVWSEWRDEMSEQNDNFMG